jgi:hypothetical protein
MPGTLIRQHALIDEASWGQAISREANMREKTKTELRNLAHRLLMKANSYDEALRAFGEKAHAMKTPVDGPQDQYEGEWSEIFYITACDSADVRSAVEIGRAPRQRPDALDEIGASRSQTVRRGH